MIQCVDREPVGCELLSGPFVQAAVCIQSVGDDNDAVRLVIRLPLAREDLDALDAFEAAHHYGLHGLLLTLVIGTPIADESRPTRCDELTPAARCRHAGEE